MLLPVANHLAEQAKTQGAHADAFARSAFNRYYYAAFLSVRQMLKDIDASWGRLAHAEIPYIIEGALFNKVKAIATKLEKKRIISASEKSRHITGMQASTSELASLLRTAYNVRVISDYEPEVLVEFHDHSFSITGVTNKQAAGWFSRVGFLKGSIMKSYKELGIHD